MDATRRPDLTAVAAFAVMAALAIAAPFTPLATGLRVFAVFGGVLLGPASLSYRLATRHRWAECLAVGAAVNVAIVIVIGEVLVAAHFWHPVPFELLMPAATGVLSAVLLRQALAAVPARAGQETASFPGAPR